MTVSIVPEEEELGQQKYCPGCEECWPLDEDFWYVQIIPAGIGHSGGRTFLRSAPVLRWYTLCRACSLEASRNRYLNRRAAVRAHYRMWYAEHRDEIAARRRELYAARSAA